MNYIYDITLNLNKKLYEFYEWKEEDNPEFILKIPVFKIDKEAYLNIKNNDIVINNKFLELIEDKTESYSPNSINIIRYACLFACETSVFAVEFDSYGNNFMKSLITIDEENEIIDAIDNIKYTMIDYKLKKKNKNKKNFFTRHENEIKERALKKLNNIKENNEYSKLKYIFYELYDEKLDDIDKIYKKLFNVIITGDEKLQKLNNIFNIIENKKIMSNNS